MSKPHRPTNTELRILAATMRPQQLADMLGCSRGTVDVWLREAEEEQFQRSGRRTTPEAGAWRARVDEALDRCMNTIIGTLLEEFHDPKDKIAQTTLALKAVPVLIEAKATAPATATVAIDRTALLAKAREASKGADRRLRLVGS